MKILVTGGCGFIGSNYIRFAARRHTDWQIVNVDALTYAGNLLNLQDLGAGRRYRFVRADIADAAAMEKVIKSSRPAAIVNFAAESHVDRSVHVGADAFIRTNVLGTQVLLDLARRHGVERYLQISTDEVYGSLGTKGAFTEKTPIQPNNPYSATKAAADMLVRAAHHCHGLNAVITRCSNNYGPYQFPEKLIPLMIANATEDKPLPVYGDGLHRRDWIHVADHGSAIDRVLRKGRAGEVYNIGMGEDVPNLVIVKAILKALGKPLSLIRYVADRPGHDRRYSIDPSKLRRELGWRPAYTFAKGLHATIAWYLNNGEWLAGVRSGDYQQYYRQLYGRRLR